MLDLLPVTMLPDLYSQEQEQDPMVHVRFHTANDEYQWFLTEFSQKDQDTCFGYIVSADGTELGYFSLTVLQLLGDSRDTEKLRKLRRRSFHKGMVVYQQD